MNKSLNSILSLTFLLFNLLLCSCGDDDQPESSSIVGEWSGTSSYNNPVGGTKFRTLNVNFSSDGSGMLEYISPVDYRVVAFTYKVKGDLISCDGYVGSITNPDVESYSISFRIKGDRLYPQDHYTSFILTRDGSVETDSSGNEIVDSSDMLEGIWKRDDGATVLVIGDHEATEYELLQTNPKIYTSKTDYSFSYDYREDYIVLGTTKLDILSLTSTYLSLKRDFDNKIFNFTKGTQADIPSNGDGVDNKTQIEILEKSTFGWVSAASKYRFNFYGNGNVSYIEKGGSLGSSGTIYLSAGGTYSLRDKTLTCYFEDVSWEYGSSAAKDFFPGWTSGKSTIKVYTVEKLTSESLVLVDSDGFTYNLTPSY